MIFNFAVMVLVVHLLTNVGFEIPALMTMKNIIILWDVVPRCLVKIY